MSETPIPRGRSGAPTRPLIPLLALVLVLVLACSGERGTPPPPDAEGGRLVLLLVVDQLGSEPFSRAETLYRGGFARLLAEGVLWTEGRHAHALTETAPGHATLVTGSHPRRHGIAGNYWGARDGSGEVYAVDDPVHGTSPHRLLVSSLGDWAKAADPRTKVFAASAKDRAAVLLGGLEADGAFWYDRETGEMTTSTFYGETPPAWLRELNRERLLDRHFGQPWEPLPVDPEALAALGVESVDLGLAVGRFPHVPGSLTTAPSEGFYGDLYSYPWIDDHVAELARRLVVAEDLGDRGAVDVLALSFSALDSVGHRYGPDSPEALDVLLRLDRTLGALLDFLEDRIGAERLVVGLSADHGVAPLPELRRARGLPAERIAAPGVLCVQRLDERLDVELGEQDWMAPGPVFRAPALAAAAVDAPTAERTAARLLESCPGVARVWTRGELLDGSAMGEPFGTAFVHSYPPDRGPDLLLQLDEFLTPVRRYAATHGSVYPYDARVPILVRAAGIQPARRDGPAASVDLAPTLAARIGVEPPPDIDGGDLLAR